MNATAPAPSTVDALLCGVLEAHGISPPKRAGLHQAFRNFIGATPGVLLVDDAGGDVTALHNLIDAPLESNWCVIVTTRFHSLAQEWPTAVVQSVGNLPAGDVAVDVLLAHAGAELRAAATCDGELHAALRELVERYGCIALALEIAGRRLSVRRGEFSAAYIRELVSEWDVLNQALPRGVGDSRRTLEMTLASSFDPLPADERNAVLLASCLRFPFDELLFREAWRRIDKNGTHPDALEDVVSFFGFVSFDPSLLCYRMHDVVRDFLLRKVDESSKTRFELAIAHGAALRFQAIQRMLPDGRIADALPMMQKIVGVLTWALSLSHGDSEDSPDALLLKAFQMDVPRDLHWLVDAKTRQRFFERLRDKHPAASDEFVKLDFMILEVLKDNIYDDPSSKSKLKEFETHLSALVCVLSLARRTASAGAPLTKTGHFNRKSVCAKIAAPPRQATKC